MAYQIHIEVKEQYLLAVFAGTFDKVGYKENLSDILLQSIKNERLKLLLDVRNMSGNLTTIQRHEVATYFTNLCREHPYTRKIQVAVVGDPPLIDPNRFGETVAINLGLNISVTNDMDEALKWLGVE